MPRPKRKKVKEIKPPQTISEALADQELMNMVRELRRKLTRKNRKSKIANQKSEK